MRRTASLVLALATLVACGRDGRNEILGELAYRARDRHATLPPAFWVIQEVARDTCVWKRLALRALPSLLEPYTIDVEELARFPAGCQEADLAWLDDQAVVRLTSEKPRRNRLFAVGRGRPPVELPLPPGVAERVACLRGIGLDDAPLAFTAWECDTKGDYQARAYAFEGGAWLEREHLPHGGYRELERWRSQRGHKAETVRTLGGLTALAEADAATIPDSMTEARQAGAISRAIETQPGLAAGQPFAVTALPTRWLGFDAGGVRLAIRETDGRLRLDLRRQVGGAWQRLEPGNHVDGIRREVYPAGIEVRGTWLLATSDGRAGVLLDAATGTTLWGAFDTALALFAPP